MKKIIIVFALAIGLGLYAFIPQGNAQMGAGMMGGQGGSGMVGPVQPNQGGSGQWNYCPYCGRPLPRGGYGMGPRMMGRGGYGMMGPGMMGGQGGYGMMGPGMMGGQGGYGMMGPQYQGNRKALTEKDATGILQNYLKANRNPNLKLGKIEDKGDAFEARIVTKKEGALVDKIAIDKKTGWMRSVY
ncbi:MAG: hypothetical protein JRI80_04135 [Deltaproteobacteria bacterium]|nr:hypothetical protein [Deltaproteobacteria bacterium]